MTHLTKRLGCALWLWNSQGWGCCSPLGHQKENPTDKNAEQAPGLETHCLIEVTLSAWRERGKNVHSAFRRSDSKEKSHYEYVEPTNFSASDIDASTTDISGLYSNCGKQVFLCLVWRWRLAHHCKTKLRFANRVWCIHNTSVGNLLSLIPSPHFIGEGSDAYRVNQPAQGFPASKGWSFKSTAWKSKLRASAINHEVTVPFIAGPLSGNSPL